MKFNMVHEWRNQYGWHFVGVVFTSADVDVRVKIVKGSELSRYEIAWDGRMPAMAEWSDINSAVIEYIETVFDVINPVVKLANSTV